MLRVTPVYGSEFDSHGPAPRGHSTLVEYADVRVLINVGGPLEESLPALPAHDCLLVTDSTLESMGGLALYSKAHPDVPVYATFPTVKMGQMTLWDTHAQLSLDGGKPPFSLEEMDQAISQMNTIKYSQPILLPSKEAPLLSITAHRAGHVVGGAFYILQRLQDETIVVVTSSTYHIAKELHLDSSTLLKYGATPDVLVTYPGGPAMRLVQQVYSERKLVPALITQSHRNLTEHILSVLRREGNVLLPVDASGRVLELILLLNQHWERHRLQGTYNLVWLGPMVGNTLDFCRSQLEWMASSLGNQFDTPGGRGHPYALQHVQLCTSVSELDTVLAQSGNNPSCVLASGLSLDHGPARDLFLRWADNDNNAVIFTDSSQCHVRDRKSTATPPSTAPSTDPTTTTTATTTAPGVDSTTPNVAGPDEQQGEAQEDDQAMVGKGISEVEANPYTASYQLLQHWCQAKLADREMEDSVEVDVLVPRRMPLAGADLKVFLEQEEEARLARRKQEEKAAMLLEVELAKGRLRLGEEQANATDGASEGKKPAALSVKTNPNLKYLRPKKKSRFDSSLFLKFSKPLHLTFELREDAVGVGQKDSTAKFGIGETVGNSEVLEDDYGIAVVPEHFVDIVTGVDPSKFAGGSGRIGEEVLRRGFGFGGEGARGGDLAATSSKSGDGTASGKDAQDELDERGMEAADLCDGRGIIRGRNGRSPMKVATILRRIQIFCEIDYIPLEGRVDSRAARQSVRALQPRQVVVLGGPRKEDETVADSKDLQMTADEVMALSQAAESFTTSNQQVQTPRDQETASLEVGHAAYSVRMIATPYRTKEEKKQEEEVPEPVEVHESKLGACTVGLLDYVATGQKVALDGSIVLAPRKASSNTVSNSPSVYLSDGDVLLTDLRSEIIAQGMKAEYSTHSGYAQLVVNGKVIVRKDQDTGRLDIEGPLCEDFFAVRTVVCGQFVTV